LSKTSGQTGSMEIGNMKLTEKEIFLAETLLSRYEKRTTSWPRRRWVFLVIAIAGICVGAYLFLESWIEINSEASYEISRILESDDKPTFEEAHLWAVGSMLKVAKLLELRHQMLVFMYLEATSGFLIGVFSISLLVIIIRRWNMDERDALICKVLRAKWEDELANKRTDN
jgi:hypothetical protein